MSRRRPVIGISGPDRGGAAAWLFTRMAVHRSGGRPVRIQPRQPVEFDSLDGLIIGGGADIDPAIYGEEENGGGESEREDPRPLWRRLTDWLITPIFFLLRWLLSIKTMHCIDPARDALEKELIHRALAAGLPLLGICRGAQLLNVVRGGTLHQDLHEFYEETPHITTLLPRKTVNIAPNSHLAAILQKTRSNINALHRQGINELGYGLRVVAAEENGIVQAVEDPDAPFLLGVQWHPEYLPHHRSQRQIFKALVTAAQDRAAAPRS